MLQKLPSISLVACTLNTDLIIFEKVLKSVQMQDYPKHLLEYVIVDGGSKNGTIELAKKYGCRVIAKPGFEEKDDYRFGLGMKEAKGELILTLQSDNILPDKNWISRLAQPFLENKDIFCTYSAYNTYEKGMPLTTRYCALFGSPDPTLYYLHKSEKIRMDEKTYSLGRVLAENADYYTVTFSREQLPTLGNNGHMFRRSAIITILPKDLNNFTHTDSFIELYESGYTTFGVVKNSLIHTTNPDLFRLVKRRVEVKKAYYDGRRGKRKYLVYNPNSPTDRINLLKYIFFSITIFEPLYESIRGYIRICDVAWFLHPLLCLCMVIGYGKTEIEWRLKNSFSSS